MSNIRESRAANQNTEHETTGTVRRIESDSLFKYLPEAILKSYGPIKWPTPLTFTDIGKAVLVFVVFIVKVVFAPVIKRSVYKNRLAFVLCR